MRGGSLASGADGSAVVPLGTVAYNSPAVVTKKIDKPLPRVERRGRTSALNAPRRRVHALAPEHIGEMGSIAALVVAVLGLAVVILGAVLVVNGITIAGRYSGSASPPPNLNELGMAPILSGVGAVVSGILLTAAPLALIAEIRRARLATILVSLLAGIVSVGVLLLVIQRPGADPVVIAALGLAALLFGASALILSRPGR